MHRLAPLLLTALVLPSIELSAQARDFLVTSWNNSSVLRYDGQTGAFVSTFVSSGSGNLSLPHSACFGEDGNLYVSSFGNNRVIRYDGNTGAFIDAFVSPGSGGLSGPTSVSFGPSGDLYVSSFNTPAVLRYDGDTGAFVGAFITSGNGLVSAESGHFGPDGHYYLANSSGNNVLHYDGDGNFIGAIVGGALTNTHDAIFGPNGNLFATAFGNRRVNEYDGQTGAFLQTLVPAGNGLLGPHGMYFDEVGFLYVAAFNNDRVIRYDAANGSFDSIFVTDGSGGLDGPISVTPIPLPAAVTPLGCGVNPAGSFVLASGQPSIGTPVTFHVDNPIGMMNIGAISIIAVAHAPNVLYPCGSVFPGFGMGPLGTPGEYLLDGATTFAFLLGSLWGGPGNPSVFNTMIPMNLNLVGETVFLQGVMNDGGGGPGNQIGLTEGLEFLVGF